MTKKLIAPVILFCVFAFIISCVSTVTPRRQIQGGPEVQAGQPVQSVPASPPSSPGAKFEAQVKEIEASKQVKAMNERILMAALSSRQGPHRDYKIGPEDLLEISVFEDEKLNKTVRVSSQGNISLPLLGIIRVKGLTPGQLEKEIRDLLQEKYFQDPHVSVFIKEFRNQRVSVIGTVEKPGVFDVTGQRTVLDMLAMAGGLKPEAGQLLFLIRPPNLDEQSSKEDKEGEGNQPRTFLIDLEELLVKGDLSLNFRLQHGDVINIPPSGKIFVGGEVSRQGGFVLGGKKLTVSQAIALAGGLSAKANGSETMIFRYSEKGTGKEILTVDVYAIQKGKDEDLYLRENDIIMVPKSGAKTFLTELWDFVKGRIGSVALGTL